MQDPVGSCLLEAAGGFVDSLSRGGEGADSQEFDLLCMTDAGAGVDDLLSCVVKVLREVTKLLNLSFDEGVTELLDGAVDDRLIGLPRLEDPLAKWIERGLCSIARSCPKSDRKDRVSAAHGEMSARAGVIEYKMYVFGLALVVIRVVNGSGDAEPPIGSILDERRSGMGVACVVVDDILVGTHYDDRGSG